VLAPDSESASTYLSRLTCELTGSRKKPFSRMQIQVVRLPIKDSHFGSQANGVC
jgi:hypothetical protein